MVLRKPDMTNVSEIRERCRFPRKFLKLTRINSTFFFFFKQQQNFVRVLLPYVSPAQMRLIVHDVKELLGTCHFQDDSVSSSTESLKQSWWKIFLNSHLKFLEIVHTINEATLIQENLPKLGKNKDSLWCLRYYRCLPSLPSPFSLMEAPLQLGVAKQTGLPLPQLPVKAHRISLGGAGCPHFSTPSTPS